MTLMWNEELETGNQIIDFQHKQLVEIYGLLMDVFSKEEGHTTIGSAIEFMCDYTVRHFSDEEELQRECNYPDYERHKRLHEDLKMTVSVLSTQLNEDGISQELITKFNSNIGDWLRNHIMCEDIKVAQFIKNKTCL